jgi:FkbM family methyltransferase|nr:MAG TPA: methyltransferase, FkbM family [Caudoviricetes sp.]
MKNHNGTWLPNGDTFFETRGDYESHDYSRLQPYLANRRVAVDVGAHVGYWSRRLVKDFDYVYAFEAEAEHAECLRANVVDNNIQIHEVAISSEPGVVKFSKTVHNSGMSHVSDSGVEVECEPLDRWKIRDVDLIKIDVEGHELAVLQGAEHTILRNRPVLFMEILNSTPFETRKAILDLMIEWNYTLKETIAENYIFVSAT